MSVGRGLAVTCLGEAGKQAGRQAGWLTGEFSLPALRPSPPPKTSTLMVTVSPLLLPFPSPTLSFLPHTVVTHVIVASIRRTGQLHYTSFLLSVGHVNAAPQGPHRRCYEDNLTRPTRKVYCFCGDEATPLNTCPREGGRGEGSLARLFLTTISKALLYSLTWERQVMASLKLADVIMSTRTLCILSCSYFVTSLHVS